MTIELPDNKKRSIGLTNVEAQQTELMRLRIEKFTEFLYQFNKTKKPGPFRNTQPKDAVRRDINKALKNHHRVSSQQQEEPQPRANIHDVSNRDYNGFIKTPDERMHGLDFPDFDLPVPEDAAEKNIRCKECLDKHGVSPIFQSLRLKDNHMKSQHKIYKCERCDKQLDNKKAMQRHKKGCYAKEPVKHYPCEQCGEAQFETFDELKLHMVSSEGGACLYSCPLDGCQRQFWDKVQRDIHQTQQHQNVTFEELELVPICSSYKTRWLRENEKLAWEAEVKQLRDNLQFTVDLSQRQNHKDEILKINLRGETRGWAMVRKKQANGHTWAVLKDKKLPGQDKREIGYLTELLLQYLNNQNVATFYVYASQQAAKFWRRFNFFRVCDPEQLARARSLRQEASDEIIMSARTKDFFLNEPSDFKFPDGLRRTPLSNQLRQLREAINISGAKRLVEQIALDAYFRVKKVKKEGAVVSDQVETPWNYIVFAARKCKVPTSVLWDQHRFRPNWRDGYHYNNLKERYGSPLSWKNCPYSQTSENMAWGAFNWLRGYGSVFLIQNRSTFTHTAVSLIDAFSVMQGAGAVTYVGHKKPIRDCGEYVYTLTPEHLEFIDYLAVKKQENGQFVKNRRPEEQNGLSSMVADRRDIALRQLAVSANRRKAMKVAHSSMDFVGSISEQEINNYKQSEGMNL